MIKKQVNKVGFAEIFQYAKEKFNIHWNPANDMFFRTEILTFRSMDDIELWYLEERLQKHGEEEFDKLPLNLKAFYILRQFMIDNDVEELQIDNR